MVEKTKSKRFAKEYAEENHHYDAGYMFLEETMNQSINLLEKIGVMFCRFYILGGLAWVFLKYVVVNNLT